MILRWPRATDPRLVLGSALALVLPVGADLAALAQTPQTQPVPQAPPAIPAPAPDPAKAADALKRHDKELDAIRAKQRQSADSQTKLKLQIDALSQDHRTLTAQLITAAARVRDVEGKIEAAQARLQALDRRQDDLQKTLDERRSEVIEILAALERVGRDPPPAVLVRPEDALDSLRTAITLGTMLPDMRARAAVLVAGLSDLLGVRKDIVAQRAALSQNLDQLAFEQLRLKLLVDARQRKQAEAERALASEQQQAVELAQRAANLKDLIAQLETSLNTNPAARAVGVVGHPDLAALNDPGRLSPAVAFADLRGQLHLPVNGSAIRAFGAPNGIGGTQKGVSIAAAPGAQITSPCDSWVVYAGPFRSYGQLLILNAGGGYHVLLAGMERISVDLGQFVLTGEPVAAMGGQTPASADMAAGSKQPVLYVEFRKGGTPIDPSPWWATNEGEKVRG
jgi:septal ring factor EnvC (AmiA/AmiB activator)